MKVLYQIILSSIILSSCSLIFDSKDETNPIPFNKSNYLISLEEIEPYTPSKNNFTGFTTFDQKLVYRTSYYSNLYQFDLQTKLKEELVLDYPGTYSAHDSIYIFYEMGNFSIWRYNTLLKKTDLKFNLTFLDNSFLDGLTTYNDLIYVYAHSYPMEEKSTLLGFNKEGTLHETIQLNRPMFCIAIYNGIIFSRLYNSKDDVLIRFNLITKEFLPDIRLDENSIGNFCFNDNNFYYIDLKKRQIRFLDASLLPFK